jgi:hypothetical protein
LGSGPFDLQPKRILLERTLGMDLGPAGVNFCKKSSAGSLEKASFMTDSTSWVTSSLICGFTSLMISWGRFCELVAVVIYRKKTRIGVRYKLKSATFFVEF